MRKPWLILVIAILSFLISGCSKKTGGCGDEETLETLKILYIENIRNHVKKVYEASGTDVPLDDAKVRAFLESINFEFVDIITTKSDPNSTKNFCEAKIIATIPLNIVKETDEFQKKQNLLSIAEMSSRGGLTFNAGAIESRVEYAAQPTDNGKKVYVETANESHLIGIISSVTVNNLLKPIIEANEARLIQQQEDEARISMQEEQQEALQMNEFIKQLAQAKVDIKKENDKLNLLWKSATEEFRNIELPSQRAWLEKRENDCKNQAEEGPDGAGGTEYELIKLECEVSMTRARIIQLQKMINKKS